MNCKKCLLLLHVLVMLCVSVKAAKSDVVTYNTAGATISFSDSNSYEWEWDSLTRSLKSTNYGVNGSSSLSTITFVTTSTSFFSFDYCVSSELSDKLTITLDGLTIVNGISGKVSKNFNQVLSKGTHTLILKYVKDSSYKSNDDRAYVSNMKFEKCADVVDSWGRWSSADPKYTLLSDGTLYITGQGRTSGEIRSHRGIKKVIIGEGITGVKEEEFQSCKDLEEVHLSNTIETIGDKAFQFCHGLKLINIPEGVTSLGFCAFHQCVQLEKIQLPNTLISIGSECFWWCLNLKEANIPKSVTNCGDYVFDLCENLSKVIIEEGVSSLNGKWLFNACRSLNSIVIPSSIISIDEDAFKDKNGSSGRFFEVYNLSNCEIDFGYPIRVTHKSLSEPSVITQRGKYVFGIADHVPYLLRYTDKEVMREDVGFGQYFDVTSLVLPESFDGQPYSIEERAFSWSQAGNIFPNLQSIIIPMGVKNICAGAFSGCEKLSNISVPSSVIEIGSNAFGGTAWFNNQRDGLVYINSVAYGYKGEMPENTAISLRVGTVSLTAGLFSNKKNLKNIILPNSLISIGSSCFRGCSGLTSISIPSSVTSIGDNAFSGCDNLASLVFKNTEAMSLGNNAFKGCSSLKNVDINDISTWCTNLFVNEYANPVFYSGKLSLNGIQISNLTIPNDVESIGQYAFYNNKGTSSITIPLTVKVIGAKAFYGNSSLQSVNVDNIKSWCEMSFEDKFSNPLTCGRKLYIGDSQVRQLVIPDNVGEIKDYAFSGCSDITSISLGKQLKRIGNEVWDNLSDISEIYCYASNPPVITETSFGSISTSTPLYISILDINNYYDAPYWYSFTNMIPIMKYDIVDGERYTNNSTIVLDELTYTRNFTTFSLAPLYVPFSMEYDDWASQGLTVAKLVWINETEAGTDFIFTSLREGQATLPNMPYIVRASSLGEKTITLHNTTLYPAESNSIDNSTMDAKYTITGIYEPTLLSGAFAINTRGQFIKGNGTLGSFRWYMTIEDRESQLLSGRNNIKVFIDDEEWDVTDGVGLLNAVSDSADMYNLMGQKVNGSAKGIVIRNGKKIFVK